MNQKSGNQNRKIADPQQAEHTKLYSGLFQGEEAFGISGFSREEELNFCMRGTSPFEDVTRE